MTIRIQAYWILVVAFVVWGVAIAQTLSPASYIDIELKVRQITNEGMQQRLFLIKLQSEDSVEDQYELDAETYNMINAVYESHGVTAGSHAAYGTRNVVAIDKFLMNKPTIRQELEAIGHEFDRLSSLIGAELVGN